MRREAQGIASCSRLGPWPLGFRWGDTDEVSGTVVLFLSCTVSWNTRRVQKSPMVGDLAAAGLRFVPSASHRASP